MIGSRPNLGILNFTFVPMMFYQSMEMTMSCSPASRAAAASVIIIFLILLFLVYELFESFDSVVVSLGL